MFGARWSAMLLAIVAALLCSICLAKDISQPYRVVLMSDTHVIGPQYKNGSESNPVDNASILKTPARLQAVVDTVNKITPKPDIGVFVGDVVHNALDIATKYEWFVNVSNQPNPYTVAANIFNKINIPVHYLWGNHDYKTNCGNTTTTVPHTEVSKLISHFFNATPYHSTTLGPWKLVFTNSVFGITWNATSPRCSTSYSSYGPEQLAWIAKELDAGMPTILFTHFPLAIAARNETTQGDYPDILTLVSDYDNIRQVFSGHFHRGNNWGNLYPFPFWTLPAIRYDADNFFMLELDRNGSRFKVVDWAKNKGGARCSDTWSYNGTIAPVRGANETGDCGEPTAAGAATYKFTAPVNNLSAYTAYPVAFNPEPSCSVELVDPFLQVCLTQGASSDCCGILADIVRPSSAAYFSSCLCKPAFYTYVSNKFATAKQDLGAVLGACVTTYKKVIPYIDQESGSCPAWNLDIPSKPSVAVASIP